MHQLSNRYRQGEHCRIPLNNTYLKDSEMVLKLTEYKKLLAKRVYLMSYIAIFLSPALYWKKQLFIIESNSVANGRSLSCKHFPILRESKIIFQTH